MTPTKPSADRPGDLHWFKSSHSSNAEPNCVEVALSWQKSSYSSNAEPACVEVAQSWHKSSHSSNADPDCVEVAECPTAIHVRDSKDPEGPHLTFTPTEWTAFLAYAATTAPS